MTKQMRPESWGTVHAVANGIELATGVLQRLTGGSISTKINDTAVTANAQRELIASIIRRQINQRVKG